MIPVIVFLYGVGSIVTFHFVRKLFIRPDPFKEDMTNGLFLVVTSVFWPLHWLLVGIITGLGCIGRKATR